MAQLLDRLGGGLGWVSFSINENVPFLIAYPERRGVMPQVPEEALTKGFIFPINLRFLSFVLPLLPAFDTEPATTGL